MARTDRHTAGPASAAEHSEDMARLIDAEASRILVEAHVKVSALLARSGASWRNSRADYWRKRWWRGRIEALLAGATQS